jgi:hypothetical protein
MTFTDNIVQQSDICSEQPFLKEKKFFNGQAYNYKYLTKAIGMFSVEWDVLGAVRNFQARNILKKKIQYSAYFSAGISTLRMVSTVQIKIWQWF